MVCPFHDLMPYSWMSWKMEAHGHQRSAKCDGRCTKCARTVNQQETLLQPVFFFPDFVFNILLFNTFQILATHAKMATSFLGNLAGILQSFFCKRSWRELFRILCISKLSVFDKGWSPGKFNQFLNRISVLRRCQSILRCIRTEMLFRKSVDNGENQ